MENVTTVNEFLLLGLTSVQQLQPFFFVIFLIIYDKLGWKQTILVIAILEPKLHSPMYFSWETYVSLSLQTDPGPGAAAGPTRHRLHPCCSSRGPGRQDGLLPAPRPPDVLGLLYNRHASTEQEGGLLGDVSSAAASQPVCPFAAQHKGQGEPALATPTQPDRGKGPGPRACAPWGSSWPGSMVASSPCSCVCMCVYPSGAEWSGGPLCLRSAPPKAALFLPASSALCSQQPLGLIAGSPPHARSEQTSRLFSQLLLRIRRGSARGSREARLNGKQAHPGG